MKKNDKVLIIGCTGMLGSNLFVFLKQYYNFVYGTCRNNYDVKNNNIYTFEHTKDKLEQCIKEINPSIILNCIALLSCNNDKEKINMTYSNSILPIEINNICNTKNIYLIHFSTDAVFESSDKYHHINSVYSPTTFYGTTKILSENIRETALVLRICPIGFDYFKQKSLFNFIYNSTEKTINGFENCFFNGLTTIEIGKQLLTILDKRNIKGIHHITGPKISKLQLLQNINDVFDLNINIIPKKEPYISRLLKDDLNNSNNLNWITMINELKVFIESFELIINT